jgi:hypothetical protein
MQTTETNKIVKEYHVADTSLNGNKPKRWKFKTRDGAVRKVRSLITNAKLTRTISVQFSYKWSDGTTVEKTFYVDGWQVETVKRRSTRTLSDELLV